MGDKKPESTAPVIIQLELSSSLSNLAESKNNVIDIFNGNVTDVKRKHGLLIEELTLESYVNEFPCSLGLTIDGLKGQTLKSYGTNGLHCNYIVFSKAKKIGANVVISKCDIGDEIAFFSKYPGYTLDTIDKGFVVIDKDAIIKKEHPVVNMIAIDMEQQQKDPKSILKKFSSTHYKVDSQIIESTVAALKQNLEDKIPVVKENELKLRLNRAVTSTTISNKVYDPQLWKDPKEIYDNLVAEKTQELLLSKKFRFQATFRIKYRTIHHKEEDEKQ